MNSPSPCRLTLDRVPLMGLWTLSVGFFSRSGMLKAGLSDKKLYQFYAYEFQRDESN